MFRFYCVNDTWICYLWKPVFTKRNYPILPSQTVTSLHVYTRSYHASAASLKYLFSNFLFFLTGALLKPPFSNMNKKLWYILLDLYEFFQILENSDFFSFEKNISQKRKVGKKSEKNSFVFFDILSYKKLRRRSEHHRQTLIEMSRMPHIYVRLHY